MGRPLFSLPFSLFNPEISFRWRRLLESSASRFRVRIKNHRDFNGNLRTSRRELPLHHGLLRALGQDRIAANHFGVSDRTVGLNKDLQADDASNSLGLEYPVIVHRRFL